MALFQSRAVAHRALRVDVDDERLEAAARERRSKIDCCGGFAYSALLADYRENLTQVFLMPRQAASRR